MARLRTWLCRPLYRLAIKVDPAPFALKLEFKTTINPATVDYDNMRIYGPPNAGGNSVRY